MSHLDNGFRSLTLQRFPATDDVNPLQAWEAADEYLLQQLDDTEIRGPVLILNDAFGALSVCWRNISVQHWRLIHQRTGDAREFTPQRD